MRAISLNRQRHEPSPVADVLIARHTVDIEPCNTVEREELTECIMLVDAIVSYSLYVYISVSVIHFSS